MTSFVIRVCNVAMPVTTCDDGSGCDTVLPIRNGLSGLNKINKFDGQAMKINLSKVDRIFRIIVGVILVALAATGVFAPWGWAGFLFLLTGIIKYCPAYAIFGLNSNQPSNK